MSTADHNGDVLSIPGRGFFSVLLVVRSGLSPHFAPGFSEIQNGPRRGHLREVAFLSTAERGFLHQKGLPALETVLSSTNTDLTPLSRSSAVSEDFAKLPRPPVRWVPTLVVPKESEQRIRELGAQRTGSTWWVPPHLDPFVFDRWLSPESRFTLASNGPIQLLPAPRAAAKPTYTIATPTIPRDAGRGQLFNYTFVDKMGTSVIHESEFRVLAGSTIQLEGRFFEVLGERGGAIACEETAPPHAYASRTAFAEEISTFLRKRGRADGEVTEEKLKATVLEVLAEWFDVALEVWGHHPTGKRMRIDAVLRPKVLDSWRTKDIALGLEFKSPASTPSQGNRDGAVMAQTLDYAMCEFEGYGNALVFISPTPVHLQSEVTLFRFLAQYGVGRVDLETKQGITFYLGEKSRILWSEARGVAHIGRSADLSHKYGNRSRRS